jgi:hypothetical protein
MERERVSVIEGKDIEGVAKSAVSIGYKLGWEDGWNAAHTAIKTIDGLLREQNNGEPQGFDAVHALEMCKAKASEELIAQHNIKQIHVSQAEITCVH